MIKTYLTQTTFGINMTCNNSSERIKIVQGNVMRIAIPLTLRTIELVNGLPTPTDTDFIPSSKYPVIVVLDNSGKQILLDATVSDGNVVCIEDSGTLPIGTYDIIVSCKDEEGRTYRFKQKASLKVVDTTKDADITPSIEFESDIWYLDGAIFLAIGGSSSNETDPTVPNHVKNITQEDINRWNSGGGSGGDGSPSGYQVSYNDGDVVFTGSVQPTYDNGNIIF